MTKTKKIAFNKEIILPTSKLRKPVRESKGFRASDKPRSATV